MDMKEKEYSKEIARAIEEFLIDDDWHFRYDEDKGIFRFDVRLKGKITSLNYVVDVKEDEYLVYAFPPISTDPEDGQVMAVMAEFVCRASYGLINGNFELDFRDGELRYKSFVDCDDGAIPTRRIIRNSIYCPAMMFERYIPGILAVLFSGASAKEAVESCERGSGSILKALADDPLDDEAEGSDEDIMTDLFGKGTDGTSGAGTL